MRRDEEYPEGRIMVLKVRGRKVRGRPKRRRFFTELRKAWEREDCQEMKLRTGRVGEDNFLDRYKDVGKAIMTMKEVDNIYELLRG